jgi:integral membrane protein (TIGR01906 family)
LKKIIKTFLVLLMTVSGIVAILLLTLRLYAYNVSWYTSRMDKLGVSLETGMSIEDIERINVKLTDYLKGKADDIRITAKVYGVEREVFNEKEKAHMVDVRKLFDLIRILTPLSVVLFVLSAFALAKGYGKKLFYKGFLFISIVPFALMVVPVIAAFIDFHGVFTIFHEIFFTNELWILDPRTDILIQMMPQPFFESTALAWGISAGFFFILFAVVGITGLLKLKGKKKNIR